MLTPDTGPDSPVCGSAHSRMGFTCLKCNLRASGQGQASCPECGLTISLSSDLIPNRLRILRNAETVRRFMRKGAEILSQQRAEHDPVEHPSHYTQGGIEVWDALEAWGLDNDHFLSSAVEYIARAGKKDPTKTIEDLRKAVKNLNRRIANLQAEQRAGGLTEEVDLFAPTTNQGGSSCS